MSQIETTQRLAASMLTGVATDLLMSAMTDLSAEARLAYAARAWTAWALACAAMAELETLMPRSATAGYDTHAKITAFRERQA